ncbi:MAG: hypothetical protein HY934_04430 [Candidatus Firestonebacteria bacterium]|nr:hypothetical protein [Candidatus Firestonebacteria bacterium]
MNKIIFSFLFIIMILNNCFAGISVIGELSQKKIVSSGEKSEGIVLLKNTEDNPGKVKIYLTDYLFFADGRSIYGSAGSSPRSNANWISFSPNILDIPANGMATVYYTIQVPEDDSLKGVYWSIIMVEILPNAVIENNNTDKHLLGIQTILRYGIQIITNINDSGEQNIKFLDKKLILQDNKNVLQLDIENTGEQMLSPVVWIDLYNSFGKNIGRFESSEKRIFPSCSVRHGIDLSIVPKGKYKASIIVDNKNEYVFGAYYDILIE